MVLQLLIAAWLSRVDCIRVFCNVLIKHYQLLTLISFELIVKLKAKYSSDADDKYLMLILCCWCTATKQTAQSVLAVPMLTGQQQSSCQVAFSHGVCAWLRVCLVQLAVWCQAILFLKRFFFPNKEIYFYSAHKNAKNENMLTLAVEQMCS